MPIYRRTHGTVIKPARTGAVWARMNRRCEQSALNSDKVDDHIELRGNRTSSRAGTSWMPLSQVMASSIAPRSRMVRTN